MRNRMRANRRSLPARIHDGVSRGTLVILCLMIFAPGIWAQPNYGGTLQLGIEYQVYGFDAIQTRMHTVTTMAAANLVMERLFDTGPDGELKPLLGLSLTASQDGKTYTIDLRRGVTFHDGTPFNADAVVQHWKRLLEPKNRYRGLPVLAAIASIEKTDEFTVRFRLKHPWEPFTGVLSTRKSMGALIPSPKAVKEGTHNRSPVGTGPFVFKSWKSEDRVILARNPNYWQQGRLYLDEIVIRVIPEASSRYAALTSDQVELLYTDRPAGGVGVHPQRHTERP